MSPDKLVYMANQIGRAFAHEPHAQAVALTADHIRKFWEPRMRDAILAHLDDETGSRMLSVTREAVASLRSEKKIG